LKATASYLNMKAPSLAATGAIITMMTGPEEAAAW